MSEEFKPVKRNILLNPGPATTTDTVKYAQVVPDICPREKEFGDLVESILIDLVKVIHGEDAYKCVLFGGSGTASVDAAINSAVPPDGGILVIANGAYGTRMIEIAAGYGIHCVRYEIPYGDYPDLNSVEELIKNNLPKLTHIGIIHHETTTGMLNPIENTLALARKYNLEIIVDAMSSYAGIPIDVRKHDYDYVISSSNKNIQGMAGISFVLCKQSALEKMKSYPKRSYYLNLYQQYYFFDKKKQMQFTPPVQVLYALRRAITEYYAEGEHARFRRYTDNWDCLSRGLNDIGFRLLLPPEQQSKMLTSIIEPVDPHYQFDGMHDYLYARGFTIYPGKGAKQDTFRIANIGQIYPSDIEQFIIALKQYIQDRGIRQF